MYTIIKCPICGKVFGADSYETNKTFCSRNCYHKFLTLRMRSPKEAQKRTEDAKKKKEPKTDCAAYDAEKHDCKALIALFCEYGDCSFYCGKGGCNNAAD